MPLSVSRPATSSAVLRGELIVLPSTWTVTACGVRNAIVVPAARRAGFATTSTGLMPSSRRNAPGVRAVVRSVVTAPFDFNVDGERSQDLDVHALVELRRRSRDHLVTGVHLDALVGQDVADRVEPDRAGDSGAVQRDRHVPLGHRGTDDAREHRGERAQQSQDEQRAQKSGPEVRPRQREPEPGAKVA